MLKILLYTTLTLITAAFITIPVSFTYYVIQGIIHEEDPITKTIMIITSGFEVFLIIKLISIIINPPTHFDPD